jgi:hypothetical protein
MQVVRDGKPCHIHFDLEYWRNAQPLLDGDMLVDDLVALVQEQIRYTVAGFACMHAAYAI